MAEQKCPVCDGRGIVHAGFYDVGPVLHVTAIPGPESCRRCLGIGTIPMHARASPVVVCERCHREIPEGVTYLSAGLSHEECDRG